MRTNINLNDDLISRAMAASGLSTKTDVVEAALREFVERRERKDLRELFGEIQFADGYDYKAAREGKHHDIG